jgi:hypothetical protein
LTWTETPHRSIRRLVIGIFTIALGIISLVGFFSISYVAGIAILGGSFSFILIALGLGLVLQKQEMD